MLKLKIKKNIILMYVFLKTITHLVNLSNNWIYFSNYNLDRDLERCLYVFFIHFENQNSTIQSSPPTNKASSLGSFLEFGRL